MVLTAFAILRYFPKHRLYKGVIFKVDKIQRSFQRFLGLFVLKYTRHKPKITIQKNFMTPYIDEFLQFFKKMVKKIHLFSRDTSNCQFWKCLLQGPHQNHLFFPSVSYKGRFLQAPCIMLLMFYKLPIFLEYELEECIPET